MEKDYSKLFGCNIHGSIRVEPPSVKIIDTYEFQRMRNIKQLALCHYVFPCATHTRFEHSLGVYHLAGLMVKKINELYPQREFSVPHIWGDDKIVLSYKISECIKIAGLCHDIGHGPFSHVFDNILLADIEHPNKHHEIRSCLILEKICKRELSDFFDDKHIEFIKTLINPLPEYKGALYQIVSNCRNGIDVDKFDYIVRDTKNTGIACSFNPYRLVSEFIIDKNENIAFPKQSALDIKCMYDSRLIMHQTVYNHKTVKIIEEMFYDIFKMLKPVIAFDMSTYIGNMDDFCKLTDIYLIGLFGTIFANNKMSIQIDPNCVHSVVEFGNGTQSKITFTHNSTDDKLHNNIIFSKNIYNAIINRNLYHIITSHNFEFDSKHIDLFVEHIKKLNKYNLNEINFKIVKHKIGCMHGHQSPFDNIEIYSKKEIENTFNIKGSHIISSDLHIQTYAWYFMLKLYNLQCNFDEVCKFVDLEYQNFNL